MPATSSSPPSEPTPTRLPSPLPICSQPATVGLDEMELAFVAEWGGNNEIYEIRGDGAGLRRITTNLAHEAGPVWSPDGRQIAFQVLAGANAMTFTSQLHVVMADGSGDRGLAPDLTAFGVEWSPNGEQIFVGAYDGLYSVRVDSGKATRVTRGSAGPLSPDGRLVAFAVDASPDDRTDRLFIVNIDGTGLKEVGALQDYRISGIAWRPHTDEILLTLEAPNRSPALYSVTLDGTVTKLPVSSDYPPRDPRWSPDGTVLAYTRHTYGTAPQGEAIFLTTLYVATPDGEFDAAMVEPPADVETDFSIPEFVWAPDGRHIAYTTSTEGRVDLLVLNVCDGTSSLVVEDIGFYSDPSWRPLP